MKLLPCPFCGSSNINSNLASPELCTCIDCMSISKKWNTRHSPTKDWCPFATNELIKCQKAFNELQEKQNSSWISISEKLPNEDGYYIVLGKRGTMGLCMYLSDSKQFTIIGDITHYMPLPRPPKESE